MEKKAYCKKIKNIFIKQHLPFILSGIAILSGFLTYSIISYGGVSLAKRTSLVMPFIIFDIIIIILLCLIIINRVYTIYKEQKRGAIGARLHITIISIFSLVTITPSILMGVLAITFFKSGVSIWFSKPVQDTLNDASIVAELYLQEHIRNIRIDAIDFANKMKVLLCEYDVFLQKDQLELKKEIDTLVDEQNLEEAFVFCVNQSRKQTTSISSSLAVSLELIALDDTSEEDLNNATAGEIIVKENHGTVQALIQIDSELQDIAVYLWISKGIDQNILKYVTKARDSTQYYNELLENQNRFQITLMILFALSSLLLLLAAIWMGITLANILVTPITRLISAANDVSKGDLTVRIPEIHIKNELNKLVQSFNRMTERLERQNKDLIISEKKSAWSDIARKIAHEVKNPLTPIQLSAERLKRKYSQEIRSDPETFIKCIDTIIRQVSHIENLINEFSAFARMPEAIITPIDINKLVYDAVFMQKQAYPSIQFCTEIPDSHIIWPCDSQQISQVLINLLQNAINAIVENKTPTKGFILIKLHQNQDYLELIVEDNGPGFPLEKRERLFEPYYTTRAKGTGLGMAIILRIVTEHAGTMELKDAIGHPGARVEITLPLTQK